jgi:hypothetical protein
MEKRDVVIILLLILIWYFVLDVLGLLGPFYDFPFEFP